jgi:hypothetical protein
VDVIGEGAEIGVELDGSGFDWNNKEHPSLPIAEIRFSLPIVLRTDLSEYDENSGVTASTAPVSRVQIEQLIQKTESLQNHDRELLVVVRILLAVVVVVAILLVFRSVW